MKKYKKALKKKQEAKEAKKKIEEYFFSASESFSSSKIKANDCVRKARNLAMKYKLKIPRGLKRRFCKHCYSYLVPGKNRRVRPQGEKAI